jgi:hypothetical protein
MPIQRIPRYQLLLTVLLPISKQILFEKKDRVIKFLLFSTFQDLVKNTRRDHKDYKNLRAAVDAIMKLAQFINEQKRIYESTQKIIELQEKISGRYNLYAHHRRFLSEGDFLAVPGYNNFFKFVLSSQIFYLV